MKKAVLKFTACCLAIGMTVTGTGSVAFAAKDTTLAGFGFSSVQGSAEETVIPHQTVAPVETAAETEVQAAAEADTQTAEAQAAEESAPVETEVQETEPVYDTSMAGEIAFAQCEEYINVRTSADINSEVVGKVYNNGSVTILGQLGDWYEVQSGNAVGYVNAAYFATGEQAQAIADEVAYNVATVYPEALTIRSEPSEDSESIGMAYSSDELEVVAYEGDWMKVALGNDVYGYVSAYYVDYDTYYATAETLEEEQERLDREWLEYLAQQEAERQAAEQAYLEAIAAEAAAEAEAQARAEAEAAQAAADAAYQAQQSYQSQGSSDAQAAADAAYQRYLEAQAAADAATQQADEQLVYDTAAAAQAAYQEYLTAQAAADAAAQQAAADAAQQQTEAPQTEAPQTEVSQPEESWTEPETEAPQPQPEPETNYSSSSTLGSQVVNFATQFVGNPYVWGGTSLTNGADCSGFTQSVMANFGISIPRTAASQSGSGQSVALSEIQAGDLLFYSNGSYINHVTIYMGNGQVVHASSSTTGIIISDYGYRTPVCARRYW